jgi:hypothetical protein
MAGRSSEPGTDALGTTSVLTPGSAVAPAAVDPVAVAGPAAAGLLPPPSAASAEAYSTVLAGIPFCALFPVACARQAEYIEAQPIATNHVFTL